jgi:hypothetical protein
MDEMMQGFLGDPGARCIPQIRRRAPDWFELAEQVNVYSHELLLKCPPNKESAQQVLASLLFNRVLRGFQAVVLLTERGMFTEARVQRRSVLEALFVLGAIWKQPELVQIYIENDQHRRRDLYQAMQKIGKNARKEFPQLPSEEKIAETLAALSAATKGKRYLGVETLAQAAQLHDTYLIEYTVLSGAAHHTAKDLETGIDSDADGEIRSLSWGPATGSPIALLLPAIDHILKAVFAMGSIFDVAVASDQEKFLDRLHALAKRDHANVADPDSRSE